MKYCPHCDKLIEEDSALICPHCHVPMAEDVSSEEMLPYSGFQGGGYTPGMEFKSELELFGLPLIHIAATRGGSRNATPQVAKGIIAIGDMAIGVLAFGGLAIGGFCFGGASLGVVAIGGAAAGLFAFGGLSIGILGAVGGLAISLFFAAGGLALAPLKVSSMGVDAEVARFFERLLN